MAHGRYLEATIDFAFKKLLGDQSRSDLTIHFLNHILERKQGELITKVTMINIENVPFAEDKKESYLDIRCSDEQKKEYIVEVQRKNEGNFIERTQYYVSRALSSQLPEGGKYKDLKPVIFVGVLTKFNIFPGKDDYLTHHAVTNLKTSERTHLHAEYHYVELKKFNKTLDEAAKHVVDQWIYLMKYAHKLQDIPTQFAKTKEIAKALHVLEFERLPENEKLMYLKQTEMEHSEENVKRTAREEGRAEGEAKGKAEGERQAKLAIAKELLAAGMSVDKIAAITGLTASEIKE